ncbi:MAG: DUF5132 domain-containing protein [Candidatus Thiodiazotropha sp. (ex Ctena orbiculata)]|nr:DUF5132 domain-containing protein [Candidatus Thiodiazotropha taylori]
MPLPEDLLKNQLLSSEITKGFALGVGVVLLTPLVLAALSGVARPASRAALKTGILLYEKGRETAAEIGEVVDDLVAEARYELETSRMEEEATASQTADPTNEGETAAKQEP